MLCMTEKRKQSNESPLFKHRNAEEKSFVIVGPLLTLLSIFSMYFSKPFSHLLASQSNLKEKNVFFLIYELYCITFTQTAVIKCNCTITNIINGMDMIDGNAPHRHPHESTLIHQKLVHTHRAF